MGFSRLQKADDTTHYITGMEHGAVRHIGSDSFHDSLRQYIQIYHGPQLFEKRPIFRPERQTAAHGNHRPAPLLQQFLQYTYLQTPEGFLSLVGKYVGYGHTGGCFNLLVRIDQGHLVTCCEMLSHAGLSGTHEANENQVLSPALPGLFLYQVIFYHLLCRFYGGAVHLHLGIP